MSAYIYAVCMECGGRSIDVFSSVCSGMYMHDFNSLLSPISSSTASSSETSGSLTYHFVTQGLECVCVLHTVCAYVKYLLQTSDLPRSTVLTKP